MAFEPQRGQEIMPEGGPIKHADCWRVEVCAESWISLSVGEVFSCLWCINTVCVCGGGGLSTKAPSSWRSPDQYSSDGGNSCLWNAYNVHTTVLWMLHALPN